MTRASKVSLAFKKASAINQVTFGAAVVTCLSPIARLATFPNLPVPVAVLLQLNNALNSAVVAVQTTDSRQAKAALKNAVKQWISAFDSTGAYVNMVAAGNEQTIAEAGFLSTKTFLQPQSKPGLASSFQASINGFKGAITSGTKTPVPDAGMYVSYALPDGIGVSFSENTMVLTIEGGKTIYINVAAQRKTEMYNLPRATTFNVGMYVVNRAGAGPATELQQVTTQ